MAPAVSCKAQERPPSGKRDRPQSGKSQGEWSLLVDNIPICGKAQRERPRSGKAGTCSAPTATSRPWSGKRSGKTPSRPRSVSSLGRGDAPPGATWPHLYALQGVTLEPDQDDCSKFSLLSSRTGTGLADEESLEPPWKEAPRPLDALTCAHFGSRFSEVPVYFEYASRPPLLMTTPLAASCPHLATLPELHATQPTPGDSQGAAGGVEFTLLTCVPDSQKPRPMSSAMLAASVDRLPGVGLDTTGGPRKRPSTGKRRVGDLLSRATSRSLSTTMMTFSGEVFLPSVLETRAEANATHDTKALGSVASSGQPSRLSAPLVGSTSLPSLMRPPPSADVSPHLTPSRRAGCPRPASSGRYSPSRRLRKHKNVALLEARPFKIASTPLPYAGSGSSYQKKGTVTFENNSLPKTSSMGGAARPEARPELRTMGSHLSNGSDDDFGVDITATSSITNRNRKLEQRRRAIDRDSIQTDLLGAVDAQVARNPRRNSLVELRKGLMAQGNLRRRSSAMAAAAEQRMARSGFGEELEAAVALRRNSRAWFERPDRVGMPTESPEETQHSAPTLRPRQRASKHKWVAGGGGFSEGNGKRDFNLRTDALLVKAAFRTFNICGDLPRDRIPDALRQLGFPHIEDEEMVHQIASSINTGSFLDSDEFVTFVKEYDRQFMDKIIDDFRNVDLDSNKSIGAAELAIFFNYQGITVVQGIVREIIEEIKGNPDAEIETIEDFIELREIITCRAGFTLREAEEFQELFTRCDMNADDLLDLEEVQGAINFTGFPMECDANNNYPLLDKLVKGVAMDMKTARSEMVDDSESDGDDQDDEQLVLNMAGFLQVMRRYREFEVEQISLFYEEQVLQGQRQHGERNAQAQRADGTVDLEGILNVFHSLGYIAASPEVLKECSVDCGYAPHRGFYLDDVVLLLLQFRIHEGFLWSEIEEFKTVFKEHDANGSGSIDEIELGGTLRWLGFPATLEVQQDLMGEMDIDHSGRIEFDEFLKIMRRYRESELRSLEDAFTQKNGGKEGELTTKELYLILIGMGYYIPQEDSIARIEAEFGKASCNFWECMQLMRLFRCEAFNHFQENAGFTAEEVVFFRASFVRYDPREQGYIANRELAQLWDDVFPEGFSTSPDGRKIIMDMMERVDENKDGKLEWKEFLTLMRMNQDKDDYRKVLEEQEAATKAGFSRAEVKEFRQIFKMCSAQKSNRHVDFEEVKSLLETITPVTSRACDQLQTIFEACDEDSSNDLDFCEFMSMMKRLGNEFSSSMDNFSVLRKRPSASP